MSKCHCGDPEKCQVEPYSSDRCDCNCNRCGPHNDGECHHKLTREGSMGIWWRSAGELRWVRYQAERVDRQDNVVLEQKWLCEDTGEVEWRTVPTVTWEKAHRDKRARGIDEQLPPCAGDCGSGGTATERGCDDCDMKELTREQQLEEALRELLNMLEAWQECGYGSIDEGDVACECAAVQRKARKLLKP